MKSTIPSESGVEQDVSRERATRTIDPSDKGQIPHHGTRAAAEGPVASRATWRVIPASAGDHPMIHQFLVSVFHRPSPLEFQTQLEEPSYEPSHRLLIKNGSQIVAHLRLLQREMRFGRLVLPVGIITDLATLPEYRRRGCATALLAAARKVMLREGAVLGLLATDQPRFYVRRGWVVNGRHCYGTLGPREILSYLQVRNLELRGLREAVLKPLGLIRYNIRLWRHVELAALKRLYEENTQLGYGVLVRTPAYWRWLVGRGGSKQIYVAINGPDKFELDESLSPIVGYAAAREGRIVELMCSAAHPEASIQLLARACGDAIEKDFHRVRLDAPPADPLHQLLIRAGSEYRYHEADQGMVFMAHVFKPRRLLKLITRDLGQRARVAGLPRPCQLGLLISSEKYRLSVSRRNVELIPGSLGRSYLKGSLYDFNQLLLGHVDVRDAVETGRLHVSTRVALEMADALFPRLPFWRPPWDDLAAD